MPLKTYKEIGPGGIRYSLGPRGDLVNDDMFWLRFTHPRIGKQRRIPTNTNLISEARIFAAQYLQSHVVDPFEPSNATVKDIMKAYIDTQGEENAEHVQRMWDLRMGAIFGHVKADDVRTIDIRAYKSYLEGKKVSTGLFQGIPPYKRKLRLGTINRDLSNLRAAYKYALAGEQITQMPIFEIENNDAARRRGFLYQHEFDLVMRGEMPIWMRAFWVVLYAVGIRVNECRSITVGQVDFVSRILRLEETKNGEPRNPPLTETMYQLLLVCAEGKKATDLLFADESGEVMNIWALEYRWAKLVKLAGIRRFTPHDLRRSAVRNMVRRGVPEKIAMLISGHKTRHVFDHYNVTSEEDMQNAGKLIEAGAEAERAVYEKMAQEAIARAQQAVTGVRKEAVQ